MAHDNVSMTAPRYWFDGPFYVPTSDSLLLRPNASPAVRMIPVIATVNTAVVTLAVPVLTCYGYCCRTAVVSTAAVLRTFAVFRAVISGGACPNGTMVQQNNSSTALWIFCQRCASGVRSTLPPKHKLRTATLVLIALSR